MWDSPDPWLDFLLEEWLNEVFRLSDVKCSAPDDSVGEVELKLSVAVSLS